VARVYLAAKHRYPQVLRHYQQHIYKLMAEVSCRGEKSYFDSRAVKQLEKRIALLRRRAPVKPVFVTPGDSITGAHLHVARTSVRCAERRLVELLEDELVSSKSAVPFLNRLSDFLFVLANYVEQC
jgi:cob(I)alamin adenosyltransferase